MSLTGIEGSIYDIMMEDKQWQWKSILIYATIFLHYCAYKYLHELLHLWFTRMMTERACGARDYPGYSGHSAQSNGELKWFVFQHGCLWEYCILYSFSSISLVYSQGCQMIKKLDAASMMIIVLPFYSCAWTSSPRPPSLPPGVTSGGGCPRTPSGPWGWARWGRCRRSRPSWRTHASGTGCMSAAGLGPGEDSSVGRIHRNLDFKFGLVYFCDTKGTDSFELPPME